MLEVRNLQGKENKKDTNGNSEPPALGSLFARAKIQVFNNRRQVGVEPPRLQITAAFPTWPRIMGMEGKAELDISFFMKKTISFFMKKTAIQTLIETIRRFPDEAKSIDWIIGQCEEMKHEERQQIVDAWIKGNEEGWAMTTDWPEDGDRYYEQTFVLPTIDG